MDTLVIILVVGIIWYLYSKNKKGELASVTVENTKEHKKEQLLEDHIIEVQNRFENALYEERNFPDAISKRDVYLYKQFMAPTYDKLNAKYRYENDMIQKIREDWLTYLIELKSGWTSAYLSMELDDDKKTEDYDNEARASFRKVRSIEDSFAELLGDDHVKKLEDIRKVEFSQLNDLGELIDDKYEE